MLRMMGMATAMVCLASAASANDVGKGPKMCPVQVTAMVPCDTISTTPAKAEKVVAKSDMVCVTVCLSDAAWAACSGTWYANMKGHGGAKPKNDQATEFATARFRAQCGTDCRKRGTMRIGFQSKPEHGGTGEWFVFKYGHPDDPR
jgi:hypothetical protein